MTNFNDTRNVGFLKCVFSKVKEKIPFVALFPRELRKTELLSKNYFIHKKKIRDMHFLCI